MNLYRSVTWFLLGLAAALCFWPETSNAATAEDPNLCWQAPTENVDGTPLTDLDGFIVYSGPSSRNYSNPSFVIDDETLTCIPAKDAIPPGTWFVAMTAFDSEVPPNESAYSNEVTKVVADSGPQPVIVLTQETTVYYVTPQLNRWVLIPIGTVPAGTLCDMNEQVKGFGVVPVGSVTWAAGSTVRPLAVVAQCNG